ncbi:hypothetical protein EDD30_7724 [Couchioplanes caeruleus]|uniref:Uncharacterized protein n=1 Tax=Couchioplanes caeruleus TaxID=56438 RepID=A0A3N1FTJ2_9ACTN|nr:hypothetical protein EDD30_7724 [Couchioplanes caeruleus]
MPGLLVHCYEYTAVSGLHAGVMKTRLDYMSKPTHVSGIAESVTHPQGGTATPRHPGPIEASL